MSDAYLLTQRCAVTNNPCGTDTWGSKPCSCDACQRWTAQALVDAHGRLAAAEAREAKLRAALKAHQQLAKGLEDLLVCYRIGTHASDALLNRIEKARKAALAPAAGGENA